MSDDSRYEDARNPDPLAEAAATLRRMAGHIDSGEVTGVVAMIIIGGQRMYYRGFTDGLGLAELVLGTMDLTDEFRRIARGEPMDTGFEIPSPVNPVEDEDGHG